MAAHVEQPSPEQAPRKEGECLICKAPCQTVFLSKHTDPGVQALFMGIDGLCRKYSKETSQISEFQEKHRKRLLAFYREKIARLEESLRKAMLRVEQLQSMRPSQHTAFSALRSPVSTEPRGQLLRPPGSSASSERLEPMEVDLTPSPLRRPEPAGPTRVSLISPPQDGRMGSVSRLGPQQLSLTPGRTSGFQTLRCSYTMGAASSVSGRLSDQQVQSREAGPQSEEALTEPALTHTQGWPAAQVGLMLKLGWGQRAPLAHQPGHMGMKEACGFIVILYVIISSAWCALRHLDPRLTDGCPVSECTVRGTPAAQ
ncbi:probable E3 SUMO-protein ligase RNF212 [Myotis lucifugus]|uniref:probable E3 SUMO-protein ligase RNF212 n=1 Tax=Myotis lucifugus TaxID=59463 RepID=UPI000CCC2B5B|nr:probable E3 SUMO-protein ligase RNF212 [Myotis lucifugus]